MLAARGATSSATKRRTRPTSSACSAFGSLSPRIVTGPASTQLHLYLPCGVPQERDEPFELLHRVPELKGRHAQRGCRAAVAADHGHAYCPDPLFVFLIVRRVPALPGEEELFAQPFRVRDSAWGQPLQTEAREDLLPLFL